MFARLLRNVVNSNKKFDGLCAAGLEILPQMWYIVYVSVLTNSKTFCLLEKLIKKVIRED